MARIMHASDFCLGKQFSGIGKAGDFVRKAMKESFENAVTQALDQSVDLFLVSGNLFATNMVSRHVVVFVLEQVERLGKIPFIVVPGADDCLDDSSIYRYLPREVSPENFIVLGSRETPYINLSDSEITVYGGATLNGSGAVIDSAMARQQDFPGIHVAVATGLPPINEAKSSSEVAARLEAMVRAGFDYVAVGGTNYHKWNNRAYSSGSPETLDFNDIDAGQILRVDITASEVSIEPLRTGQLQWKQIELENSRFRYNIELEEELLKHSSPQTLLRVCFKGDLMSEGFLDLLAIEEEFKDRFCCLRMEDDRHFDTVRITGSQNGDALLNDYLSLLEEAFDKATPELKPKYLQALVTGNAMLSGKDVIS
jgi:DNA repair exonuclease SbcCD nuclease subunit